MDMTTLVISRKEVEAVLDVEAALPLVEEAFRLYGLGKAVMPPKTYVTLPKHNGDFRAMPAYLDNDWQAAGLKWVNVHPNNQGGPLPTVMAVLLYSDPATGFPLAVMDATHITRVRTGAAGGVAAKYLARKNASTLGLIGCGAQAETQLMAVRAVREVKRVLAFDVREASAVHFADSMSARGIGVEAVDSAEACASAADILVTTTPSRQPIVKAEWLRPGCHVNAIGADAPGKEELEPAVLQRAKVVIDDWEQASHSGEINVPVSQGLFTREQVHATMGEIVAGLRPGRESEEEITVFDSTGLAIQDIAAARHVFAECRKRGLGAAIPLVGT